MLVLAAGEGCVRSGLKMELLGLLVTGLCTLDAAAAAQPLELSWLSSSSSTRCSLPGVFGDGVALDAIVEDNAVVILEVVVILC